MFLIASVRVKVHQKGYSPAEACRQFSSRPLFASLGRSFLSRTSCVRVPFVSAAYRHCCWVFFKIIFEAQLSMRIRTANFVIVFTASVTSVANAHCSMQQYCIPTATFCKGCSNNVCHAFQDSLNCLDAIKNLPQTGT